MHTNPPPTFTPADEARARRNAAAAGRSYIDWSDFQPHPHPAIPDTPRATPVPSPDQHQPASPPAGAKRCQSAPNGAKRCHPHERCKTNPSVILTHSPTPPSRSRLPWRSSRLGGSPNALPQPTPGKRPPRALTPDQLRAARLLVAGHITNDIAAALSLNRRTIAKWKRRPAFQAELHHLLKSL
jgi:hypothetical protein